MDMMPFGLGLVQDALSIESCNAARLCVPNRNKKKQKEQFLWRRDRRREGPEPSGGIVFIDNNFSLVCSCLKSAILLFGLDNLYLLNESGYLDIFPNSVVL